MVYLQAERIQVAALPVIVLAKDDGASDSLLDLRIIEFAGGVVDADGVGVLAEIARWGG